MDSLASTNHFLSGVIATPRGGRPRQNEFRRYASSVFTHTTVQGANDSRGTAVVYEVGVAPASAAAALRAPAAGAPRGLVADYPTSFVLAEDFLGSAKKHSNFSASFTHSSLAGVAERLAKGLAAWTFFEGVSSGDLAADLPIEVTALGSVSAAVNSLVTSVYIPRLTATAYSPDTFGVLVAAVAGEGSSVITDILAVDSDGTPEVPTCDSDGLPLAIVEGLRIVGANMTASGQGPLFALAVTRGIHSVCSVVGHTDEGGVMRDVLRCGSFAAPFGGLHYGLTTYSGLPALSACNLESVSGYVDSLALTTAAAVAHCDPGQVLNGAWLPTVLDSSGPSVTLSSGDSIPVAGCAARGRSLLLSALPKFADGFVSALGTLFGASGDTDLAARLLVGQAQHLGATPRHLDYPTVAPFFWIEPTSLLPPRIFGTVAEAEGAGSLCGPRESVSRPAFPRLVHVGGLAPLQSEAVVSFKGARYVPFLHHWLGNPLNGLGAVSVKQLDPESTILPGASADRPLVRDRVLANDDLASFMWTRGQSPFPAPAEFLVTGGAIGLSFRHATVDESGMPTLEHLPRHDELAGLTVTLQCSCPRGLTMGRSNFGAPGAVRSRTRAVRALATVRMRAGLSPAATVSVMETSLSAPSFGPPLAEPPVPSVSPVAKTNTVRPERSGSLLVTEEVEPAMFVGATTGPRPPVDQARVIGGQGRPAAPTAAAGARAPSPPHADPPAAPLAVEAPPAPLNPGLDGAGHQ